MRIGSIVEEIVDQLNTWRETVLWMVFIRGWPVHPPEDAGMVQSLEETTGN